MANEKIRVLKIDNETITSKKTGQARPMRVLHCFVESSFEDPESGEVVDGSFVAKATLFDDKVQVSAGEEYLVTYRLGEGYGQDAGRMVPRIVTWTPVNKPKPVPKVGAGVSA